MALVFHDKYCFNYNEKWSQRVFLMYSLCEMCTPNISEGLKYVEIKGRVP